MGGKNFNMLYNTEVYTNNINNKQIIAILEVGLLTTKYLIIFKSGDKSIREVASSSLLDVIKSNYILEK